MSRTQTTLATEDPGEGVPAGGSTDLREAVRAHYAQAARAMQSPAASASGCGDGGGCGCGIICGC